jgi:hypothetical protein
MPRDYIDIIINKSSSVCVCASVRVCVCACMCVCVSASLNPKLLISMYQQYC